MTNNFNQMIVKARRNGELTLNSVRQLVLHIKAEHATAAAQRIEEEHMQGWNRSERIVVFLAGLMANLIDE